MAEQLKLIAEKVSSEGHEFLSSEELLISLLGVGRYIANTVLCFSIGIPKPALDTNMIRVLERVFSYESKRSRAREDRDFWSFAERMVPVNNPKEYNWGILDLASQVCKSNKPVCEDCPISDNCDYYRKVTIIERKV